MSQTPAYDALELNHKRFVDAMLVHPTGTAAYRSVYTDATPDSARAAAARLLANVSVEEALEERRRQLAERTDVTAERLIREYAAIAFSNMRTFVTWGPDGVTLMDDSTLSEADARCVSEIGETKPGEKGGGSLRIKLHDKKAALDKLVELFDITPDVVKRLFPQLKDEELEEGVLSILRRAKQRKQAAGSAAAGGSAS